jgi:hypothetical protein
MDLVDFRKRHLLEHIAIAVAAAQAYVQIVGAVPKTPEQLESGLNEVAYALSMLASVYLEPTSGQLRELEQVELIGAAFRRGATVLVLKDGTELRGITIRRGELREAVKILKAARSKFAPR